MQTSNMAKEIAEQSNIIRKILENQLLHFVVFEHKVGRKLKL